MAKEKVNPGDHWKQIMDYTYLGAYSLDDGKDRIITIKSATKESVKNSDGKEDKCLVLYFEEDEKGMIVNATNAKRIEAIYGTGIVMKWVGKRIQLYVENVKAWGSVVPALRVREFKPADKAEQNIKGIAAKVREALDAYTGDDKDAIRKMLSDKKKAGEITVRLLVNTLKSLQNAN